MLTKKNHPGTNLWSKTGLILFIGQACGGLSGLLLTFSISLANPAVINSIQGIQYIFLFFLGLVLAKRYPGAFNEKLNSTHIAGKIIGIGLIFFGLWMLSIGAQTEHKPKLGVTFSARYAGELGLNPTQVYGKILTDLNPKLIRLPLYWDEVEKAPNQFDFSQTEQFVKLAQKTGTEIIIVVGFKQPRWPECFQPDWAKSLNHGQFNNEVTELVKTEIDVFKKYPNVKYWQVENEPFVEFGFCPKPDPERLTAEIKTVKSVDNRPIIITDSGELSSWLKTMNLTEVFGTTLYRVVWSPYFGSVTYPWPPIFYHIKADIVKFIKGSSKNQTTMISELQAEPWPDDGKTIPETPLSKQIELFSIKQLTGNLRYAKETRMGPILFWGVEWWYYMEQHGIPNYWQNAKIMFQD